MNITEAPREIQKISYSLLNRTPVDYEVYKGPTGIGGVVAHWGERWDTNRLTEKIAEVHRLDIKSLPKDTGFTEVYRYPIDTSRDSMIDTELQVADFVLAQTLKANGWKAKDVDALLLGSGVPVTDRSSIDSYSREVAQRAGLRSNVVLHDTHAACASGANEFARALRDPSLQGKKVVVLAMEGIAALTPDFDPKRSDHLSMQVFSNGAAALGITPGEDTVLYSYRNKIIPDTRGALAAKMTYERLMDPNNPEIWQETPTASMIRVPKPEDDYLIRMRGKETTIFFVRNGVDFFVNLVKQHEQTHPAAQILYVAAHHPSKGVNTVLGNSFMKAGIELAMPWVVTDGNSSAATFLTAAVRLLADTDPETTVMGASYGAGGEFVGMIYQYRQRRAAA